MARNISFSVDEFYHIYNRGVEKRTIFLDEQDYDRFIKLLYLCNSEKPVVFKTIQGLALEDVDLGERIVDLGAYCLMPNHFHILAKERVDGGLSLFMGKVSTAFSMYFNKKYQRNGRLFQGSFKAKHVNSDEYLEHLYAYIHLNPLKLVFGEWDKYRPVDNFFFEKRAMDYLKNYRHSSYPDYLNPENKSVFLNKKAFPGYFNRSYTFKDLMKNYLNPTIQG